MLFATIEQHTTKITGYGQNYQDAIRQALIQSIGMIKGVDVTSIDQTFDKISQKKGMVNIAGKDIPVYVYLQSQGFISKIKTATNGVIDSYQVVDYSQKDNIVTVTLAIVYSTYTSVNPQSNKKKRTLAILPFSVSVKQDSNEFRVVSLPLLLNQDLQNAFTSSNFFRVMDRNVSDQKAYEKEMELILSRRASQSQKARFGQQVGADYLLVGNIQNFAFIKTNRSFYGGDFSQWNVQITVSYRLLETATMEILNSDTVQVAIPSSKVNQILEDRVKTKKDVVNMLLQNLSDQLSSQILSFVKKLGKNADYK